MDDLSESIMRNIASANFEIATQVHVVDPTPATMSGLRDAERRSRFSEAYLSGDSAVYAPRNGAMFAWYASVYATIGYLVAKH
jgi:hypothetical protein